MVGMHLRDMIGKPAFYINSTESPIIAAVMALNIRYRAQLQNLDGCHGICARRNQQDHASFY
jgi:hypothetical protein